MATESITVNVGGQPALTVGVGVEQVGATVQLYDDLAAVIAASLSEGDYWRLAWTGDTYHGTGEVIGQIVGGYPSWTGPIPWSVVGTTVTDVTSTHTTDGAGRPQLVVTGDGTTVKVCDLGLNVPPFATVRLHARYTQATRNNTGSTGPTLLLARTTSPTMGADAFWSSLIPQAAGWQRYYYDDWTASGTDAALTGASDTMWAGGGALVFGMRSARGVSATPARYPLLKALSADEQAFEPGNVPAGAGSWLTSSNTYRVRPRLRDTGGAATLTTTGLEITM
jgi:hypothetical protein